MSDLTFNKIAGAGLAAAFLVAILANLPEILFEKSPPAHPGYIIAGAEDTGGGPAAPDVPPDWGTVLPKADVADGEAKAAACKSCHNFDPAGTNGTGPGLYGVIGRPPASHPGFTYSDGMKAFGAKTKVWDYDHLYMFLKSPQAYVDGTKMTFLGYKQPQDRIDLIAYLHTLGSTLPVPPPNPKAAAAAAPVGAPASATPAPAAAAAKPGT